MCSTRTGLSLLREAAPKGGTRKTVDFCIKQRKPMFIVDLRDKLKPPEFATWVREHKIRTLNVAGPRESKQSGICKQTAQILSELFAALEP